MIIVTRPLPWAENLFEKLKLNHIDYQYLPAAKLKPCDLQGLEFGSELAIFLSQSGVHFADKNWAFKKIFTVGPKTALAVEQKFAQSCAYPQSGDYALAGLLSDDGFKHQIEGVKQIDVMGGTHSDVTRFQSLEAQGITIKLHPLYELVSPEFVPQAPLQTKGEIWFTSQKLMHLFFEHYIFTLNQKNLLLYDVVVPTADCQNQALKLGFKGKIAVVADPRDETFLAHHQMKHRSGE